MVDGERGTPNIVLDGEGGMRMARLYTTEEAYKKLGISQATFYRWVTEAKDEGFSEKTEPQPSVDGRERLYALSQLRWLAARHGKDLLPDEEIFVHEPQMEALRRDVTDLKRLLGEKEEETLLLRSDVQRLEQELLAMDAKVQEAYSFCVQQVGQVMAEMERIRAEFGSAPVAPTVAPSSPSPTFIETREGGQSAETQRAKTVAKATVTPASVGPAPSVKRFERPSTRAHMSTPAQDQHTWSQAELFEEKWIDDTEGRLVSRARMAKAHGIPDTNLRRDIEERQVLTMVTKRWLYKGSWKTGGFNAAQRRRVWEEYHQLSWFNPCEICLRNQHVEG